MDKFLARDYVPDMLVVLENKLKQVEPFTEEKIEQVFLEVKEKQAASWAMSFSPSE